ncbi:HPP family protein [Acinetobacter sp. BSP-153]|uniref:HPP family protein n=1 Tax=Acinetobacter sp. BSP-153 TaxID=3344663 RepID=UPI0037704018
MNPMSQAKTTLSSQSYVMAFLFILLMVVAAYGLNDREIILPEMAAMAVGLWVYRDKQWLNQPDKIFILPSLTAVIGFCINLMPISYLLKLVLVLCAMLLVMRMFNYILPPALATGFLPIVTQAYELSFLISIFVTSFMLMLGVVLFKLNQGIERKGNFDRRKIGVYASITLIGFALAAIFKVEAMALIPPITVVVYESLNMMMYSLKMYLKQVAVLTLSISMAVLMQLWIQDGIILTLIYMPLMFLLLKLFDMRIPAVYAFPFLVFVFPQDSVMALPVASGLMASFSFGCVYVYRSYFQNMGIEKSYT